MGWITGGAGTEIVRATRPQLVMMFGQFGHILADTLDRHDQAYDPLIDDQHQIIFGATRSDVAAEYMLWTDKRGANILNAIKGRSKS